MKPGPNVLSIGLISIWLIYHANADDTEDGSTNIDRWHKVYQQVHESFAVSMEKDGTELNELESHLVLSTAYANGNRHGRIYLWSERGRPMVIGSVFANVSNETAFVGYEFHSLSEHTVQAARDKTLIWRCKEPGIEWFGDPVQMAPAATRSRRLVQMRAIARSFNVERIRSATRPQMVVCRLLSQPIYRYPEGAVDVTDGAVFAYSISTDPDAFLVVEATQANWRVAFARSQILPVQAHVANDLFWSVDQQTGAPPGSGFGGSDPFFIRHRSEYRSRENPDVVLFR